MRLSLTSEQYVKIDQMAQTLSASRHHRFLVVLAGKILLNARVTRNQSLSDDVLSQLINAARRQIERQRPLHGRFTPKSGHVQRIRLCPLWANSGHLAFGRSARAAPFNQKL